MAPSTRTFFFFSLTFLFTWGLQIPGILAQHGLLPGPLSGYQALAAIGIFGPCAAAIIATQQERGPGGVRALLRTTLAWRVHPRFYALAVLPALLLTLALFGLNLAGRKGALVYFPGWAGLVLGIVISVTEEVGWRGYALPRLSARLGSFGAGIILGAIWYVWHIPMFVGMGVPQNLALVMLLYFAGASLLLTAIYERTGGSLLLVSLGHVAAHINNSHRALPSEVTPLVAHSIIYAGLGLFVMRQRSSTPHRTRAPRTSSTS